MMSNRFAFRMAAVLLAMGCAASLLAAETLPPSIKVVSLEVQPATIALKSKFDYAQLLITAKCEGGMSADVTRMVTLAAPGKSVKVSPSGLVRAAADGADDLVFKLGDKSVSIKVAVTGFATARTTSFVQDVQPALSKMGCNQGTCHGSANGKNGFKLSLRGYDPIFDHMALTDDIAGRRTNRVAPEQSLMILKATGSIPHVGGVRTTEDHPYYEVLRSWIAQGTKLDLNAPRVTKIDVSPRDPIVPLPGMKQQMVIVATYSDGTVRDVTQEAFIESGDIERLEANTSGVITTLRRGEAPVLARFEGAYVATTITIMGDRTGFAWKPIPPNNYVDEKVYAKLQRVQIEPSELCNDEEFIRRAYIDLTGLPPTIEQTKAFLADSRETKLKRDALIDSLVGSREFVEHWTNKWADLLQVNRKFLGEEGSIAFRNWIKGAVATNMPYDRLAAEVLTASGSNVTNPPASYWKIFDDPTAAMENTTHLFLSVRFNCNKCHDHPFEKWTQDQYFHLSSYFAQVGRKEDPAFAGKKIGGSAVEGAKPLVEILFDRGSGEVTHLRTNQQVQPKFPYDIPTMPETQIARRQQLARWMTSKENPYFARSYVNRLWGYLFGRGIIEPIDDIRAGNPATNPALLDALTDDFVQSGFNVQHMLKTICKSRTYQHSVKTNKWNEDDEINYARCIPRRLPAEALFDAIHLATGSVERLPGLPAGGRAVELSDAGATDPFLEDFGRPVRESSCECERSSGIVLGPVIKLISGPTVGNAISDPANALTKLVAEQPDDASLIREVFLRFLSRNPSPREIELGVQALKTGEGEKAKVGALLAEYEKTIPARQAEWEKSANREPVWNVLSPSEMKSAAGATFKSLEDKSILVGGPLKQDTYTFTIPTDLVGITGLKIEVLPDPALGAGGPGRAPNGNLVLSELSLGVATKAEPTKVNQVGLQNAQADFSQDQWPVAAAIDGNPATGWGIHPQVAKAHMATFETKLDAGAAGGSVLTVSISHQYQDGEHNIGRLRISATTSPRPFGASKLPPAIAAALSVPADKRTDAQKGELTTYFRSLDGKLAELLSELKQAESQSANQRLIGVQDLAWALINSPSFLFNR